MKDNAAGDCSSKVFVGSSGSVQVVECEETLLIKEGDQEDPLTALTLAPPGMSLMAATADEGEERLPVGFWDAMRGVIAREVREYMGSTMAAAQISGVQTSWTN